MARIDYMTDADVQALLDRLQKAERLSRYLEAVYEQDTGQPPRILEGLIAPASVLRTAGT